MIERPESALLAGVCANVSRALAWNVWALRALFIGFLAIKTIAAVAVYAGLALAFHLLKNDSANGKAAGEGLASPELSRRNERISELEQRFRDLEKKSHQD